MIITEQVKKSVGEVARQLGIQLLPQAAILASQRQDRDGAIEHRVKFGSIEFATIFPAIAQQAKPAPLPPELVPGNFVDVTAKAGVHFQGRASHTSKKYLPEKNNGKNKK